MNQKQDTSTPLEEPADSTNWPRVYGRVAAWLALMCLIMWLFTQLTQ